MEEAETLCDRVAIMDHGKILEVGTVDELVSRRFKERAVRFDAIDGLDRRTARGDARRDVASKHEDGDVLLYTRDVPATIGGAPRRDRGAGRRAGEPDASGGPRSRTSSST